ncbi:hypothetical protein F5148DRAFT_1368790 [Russula earlei]|uniref:Uncharacterized protein n=1 Tax=Russula earlei TaxID=71964 RepID=A0ACC0U667_9AGAM|nr:hypothetical protein F5148DRAFT_1368790 [Russula earlei]
MVKGLRCERVACAEAWHAHVVGGEDWAMRCEEGGKRYGSPYTDEAATETGGVETTETGTVGVMGAVGNAEMTGAVAAVDKTRVAVMVKVDDAGTARAGGAKVMTAGESKMAAVNKVMGMVDEVGAAGTMGAGDMKAMTGNAGTMAGAGVGMGTKFAFPLNVARVIDHSIEYLLTFIIFFVAHPYARGQVIWSRISMMEGAAAIAGVEAKHELEGGCATDAAETAGMVGMRVKDGWNGEARGAMSGWP